ncbi:MAG: lysylphosphatidylglycerol synthase transmembrane domain-containing protein [Arenicellales bacterium]|nr:lysylphosphatidylglycerol synthase transmembrane domain-containing protein [Arenicellales bacterium]
MNRSSLVVLLKFLVVAILLGVIFSAIAWQDSYTRLSAKGDPIETVAGRILGPWDTDPVRFQAYDSAAPQTLKGGRGDDGTTVVIAPGFLTYLRNLNLRLFAAGAGLFFVFVTVINSRWWYLLRANGLGVRFLEAQRFGWIGLFFSNVLPGATGGDVIKAVYIVRRCSGDKVRAVVSIVVDRIIGVLSLLVIGSLASLLAMDRFPVFATSMWLTGLGTFGFCFLLISPTLRRLLRFDALVARLPGKISNVVTELDGAVLYYRDHLLGIGGWILASPVIYSLFVGSVFCMDRALGVGLGIADYFFIVPVAAVIQGIPIAPAGWGIGEAAYGALIGKFGAATLPGIPNAEEVMRTRGVALSVLHRVHVAAWSLLGGLAILIDRNAHPQDDSTKDNPIDSA